MYILDLYGFFFFVLRIIKTNLIHTPLCYKQLSFKSRAMKVPNSKPIVFTLD